MDTFEALKNAGNAHFQQGRFDEAVQTYSSVLSQLQQCGIHDSPTQHLETAVRLNRAWAWIQMPGRTVESNLIAAEQDCTAVIEKDPLNVKALYRRALARERRGHWKAALLDATAMRRVEPANPSVAPLIERLQQLLQDDEDLAPKLSEQCTMSERATFEQSMLLNMHEEAEQAWRTLQVDEIKLQKVYHSSVKRSAGVHKPSKRKKVAQGSKPVAKGEISQKTDDLWASLRREETTTIAKAFPHSRKSRERQAA